MKPNDELTLKDWSMFHGVPVATLKNACQRHRASAGRTGLRGRKVGRDWLVSKAAMDVYMWKRNARLVKAGTK